MPFSTPVPTTVTRKFKEAANGLSGRAAGNAIVNAILDYYKCEVTVLSSDGFGELFRVGRGDPSHGIHGIHIHPISMEWGSFEPKADNRKAVEFIADDKFNMYLGSLLAGLETGRYRAGFKYR